MIRNAASTPITVLAGRTVLVIDTPGFSKATRGTPTPGGTRLSGLGSFGHANLLSGTSGTTSSQSSTSMTSHTTGNGPSTGA